MAEAKIRFVAGNLLEVEGAMRFYLEYILGPVQDKEDIRLEYGFSGGALVSPNDWELFAAILIRHVVSTKRPKPRFFTIEKPGQLVLGDWLA